MENNGGTVDAGSTSDIVTTTPLSATIQSSSAIPDYISECPEQRTVASIQSCSEPIRKIPFPQIQQDINATYDIFDVITGKMTLLAAEWTQPPHLQKYIQKKDDIAYNQKIKEAVTLGYDVPGNAWTCISPPDMCMGAQSTAALDLAHRVQKSFEAHQSEQTEMEYVDNSWNCEYQYTRLLDVTEDFRCEQFGPDFPAQESQEQTLQCNKNTCLAAAIGSCQGLQASIGENRVCVQDMDRNLQQLGKMSNVPISEEMIQALHQESTTLVHALAPTYDKMDQTLPVVEDKPISFDPFSGKFSIPSCIQKAQLPSVLHTTLAMRDAQLEDGFIRSATVDPHASTSVNVWSLAHCPEVSGIITPNVFLYSPLPVQTEDKDDSESEEEAMWKPGYFSLVFPRDTSVILARIFSFLSIKELNGQAQLSRHLYTATRLAVHACLKASYDQLWYLLGTKRSISNLLVSPKFSSSTHVNLDFCNLLDGEFQLKLLRHLYDTPAKRTQLTSLSQYYCYKQTDEYLIKVCTLFPNLRYINLGKCFLVTDASITALGNLPYLQHLNQSYVYNMGSTLTEYIKTSFQKLRILEIEGLSSSVNLDELKQSKPMLKLVIDKVEVTATTNTRKNTNNSNNKE